MHPRPIRLAALASAVLTLTGALAPAPASQEKAMTEHLKARVGTWDCTMTVWPAPGEPMTLKGTEVVRALGTHVLADYTSESSELPFQGHGVTSWDPAQEVFVTVWVDSIGASPAILEGTHDGGSNTITFRGEAVMHGKRVQVRQLVAVQDADHRTFDMFVTPPGGEEMPSIHVEYVRR